jgi:ATP-dependent helicase/nuclease subunit A
MIAHEIITASAGSGKTWNLVVRYIRLLALGAEPRSIIALTFSRKAAREFFTAILHRLAEAAIQDEAAAKLAADVAAPHLRRADFVRLLAALVREMPLLTLGTMDSFFVRIARSFPLELGLAGDFAILDTHQHGIEQQRVLQRVFAPGQMQEDGRREFLLAFQQATWGKEEVRLKRLLGEFLKDWQGLYLQAPRADVWGNPAAIWPDGRTPPDSEKSMAGLLAAARQAVARAKELKPAQQETLYKFLTTLESYTPGTPVPKDAKLTLEKLLEVLPDLAAGEPLLTLSRTKVTLRPPLTQHLHAVVSRLVHDTLMVCLHQTRGIHRILALYDRQYHDMVRRQGRLTFQDVQFILSGDLSATDHTLAGASREDIDYRLDATFSHWLLDEFQDTSRVQWRVMQNLCDEAIQDAEGTRSFFAVGDEKQSIFTWRGAEPGLFGDVLAFYNRPGHQAIQVTPLALSQRSGPAIIRMVNRLCGNLPRLAELDGLAGGVARWPWQEHRSARPDRSGCAAVIEVPPVEDEDDTAVAWNACADLLQELQPLRRGLTCAVLCSRNSRAAEIANVLRLRSGMEVVCESDVGIATDNPAASALLALLKAAAHPADQFSWQQVLMSPLGEVLDHLWPNVDGVTPHARHRSRRGLFTATVLSDVVVDGFEKTLRRWEGKLIAQRPAMDSFSRGRMDELCRAAREFDAGGSRDIDEFIAFAESWNIRESACRTAVQVMTIHKSKGLTFDIVLLPDLHDRYYSQNRIGLGRDGEKEISWLSLLPPKDIAAADSVFAAALDDADAAQWRERLAQLYVAVTRARRANYLLLPPAKGESVTPARIARHLLAEGNPGPLPIAGRECVLLDLEGDLAWINEVPLRIPAPVAAGDLFAGLAEIPAIPAPVSQGAKPVFKVRPSPARFAARREGRRFGTLVHTLLSKVKWSGPRAEEEVTREFQKIIPHPAEWERAALRMVCECLRDPAVARTLAPVAPDDIVWRERPFEAVIGDECVSGVFDRVALSGGGAHLIEYKTDRLPNDGAIREAVARHTRQTQIYRAALRQLTGLPDQNIRATLLFTSVPRLVEVPA